MGIFGLSGKYHMQSDIKAKTMSHGISPSAFQEACIHEWIKHNALFRDCILNTYQMIPCMWL